MMGRAVEVRAYDTTNILLSACSKVRYCQDQQQRSVSPSYVVCHASANKMLLLRSTKGQRFTSTQVGSSPGALG